jgi:L-ribulose-5-phosphate 3-epimerase UlaE
LATKVDKQKIRFLQALALAMAMALALALALVFEFVGEVFYLSLQNMKFFKQLIKVGFFDV